MPLNECKTPTFTASDEDGAGVAAGAGVEAVLVSAGAGSGVAASSVSGALPPHDMRQNAAAESATEGRVRLSIGFRMSVIAYMLTLDWC